ncbi:MAG: NADH-quinone oxidoreductase subunit C [Pseudomonadota bacterium]
MLVTKAKAKIAAISPVEIKETDYSKTGYHLEAIVKPEQVTILAEAMLTQGFYLQDVTAVDITPEMEVIYHYAHFEGLCRITARAYITREAPQISTISQVYSGANWHERETHDFFGIEFIGHPYLMPLLLPEDADFHPLVKGKDQVKSLKDILRAEVKEPAEAEAGEKSAAPTVVRKIVKGKKV